MNVQIPESLFFSLVRYHLIDDHADAEQIKKQLGDKLDALLRRTYFTRYKTAATDEEREKARHQYLDSAGILPDFRW